MNRMKNIMGDEREPELLTFDYTEPHMNLFRGGRWCGMVSPNGWSGKTAMINYKLKEPVMTCYHGNLSLTEMQSVLDAWKKFTTGDCPSCAGARGYGWSRCPACYRDFPEIVEIKKQFPA